MSLKVEAMLFEDELRSKLSGDLEKDIRILRKLSKDDFEIDDPSKEKVLNDFTKFMARYNVIKKFEYMKSVEARKEGIIDDDELRETEDSYFGLRKDIKKFNLEVGVNIPLD